MTLQPAVLHIERVVYGGYGLARTDNLGTPSALVPFTLPGEIVRAAPSSEFPNPSKSWQLLEVLQPSTKRVDPPCPHFGLCGGCHLQMATYDEQLRVKRDVLLETLARAHVSDLPDVITHSAEPWGYRNRIRLHVTREGDVLRLGYRKRDSHDILPIVTCPIAMPLLWRAAETLLSLTTANTDVDAWLRASAEIELFCNAEATKLQMNLLLSARPPAMRAGSFDRAAASLAASIPELSGAGAALLKPGSTAPQRLAAWGDDGLSYTVPFAEEELRYWIARGGFFQVNRFLTSQLVKLVCEGRSGALAWDLFAGVGLFARVLARRFEQVVAVEANPAAAGELIASLGRSRGPHTGVQSTALDFLRERVLQRERPELIVLDPPRAGAGAEVCALLARLAPREIVYVSCDPTTLARDLAILQPAGCTVAALHLVDLFPQTYHQEAVAILHRQS